MSLNMFRLMVATIVLVLSMIITLLTGIKMTDVLLGFTFLAATDSFINVRLLAAGVGAMLPAKGLEKEDV